MSGALRDYFRRLDRHLACPRSLRRRLTAQVRRGAEDYLRERPEADPAEVARYLGDPAEMARELLENLDPEELRQARRREGVARRALVAVLMSGDVQAWIEESYNGVVMPMGAQELDIPEIAEPVTLKVGASPSPHAEILEHVKPLLAEHNVELDIVEFDDYVMPNTGVEDGSLDANYFQHQPYLNDFNAEQSTHIVSVATVHYEPMGIYPGKTASLDVFGK